MTRLLRLVRIPGTKCTLKRTRSLPLQLAQKGEHLPRYAYRSSTIRCRQQTLRELGIFQRSVALRKMSKDTRRSDAGAMFSAVSQAPRREPCYFLGGAADDLLLRAGV